MEIAVNYVYELDSNGKPLRVVEYTDYSAEKIRSMFTSSAELRSKWRNAQERATILKALEDQKIMNFEAAVEWHKRLTKGS